MNTKQFEEAERLLKKIVDDFNYGLTVKPGFERVQMRYDQQDVLDFAAHFTNYIEQLKQHSGEPGVIAAHEQKAREFVRDFDAKIMADTLVRDWMYELVDTAAEAAKPISTVRYVSGGEFWRDICVSHGTELGYAIGADYLRAQLKTDDRSEREFDRELFAAMQVSRGFEPNREVYPHSLKEARELGELDQFRRNRELDGECADAIRAAIRDCCYERDHYNFGGAAMVVLNEYGFDRVNRLVAGYILNHEWDGRLSNANKAWARDFPPLSDSSAANALGQTHMTLIDAFADQTRELTMEFAEPELSQGFIMTQGGM